MIYTLSKKFIIISFLLLGFTLAGCSQAIDKNNNIEKTENNKITTDQLFQKKQECANYYSQVRQEIKNNRGEYAKNYSIDEIFYSQKRNTCISIVSLLGDKTNDGYWFTDVRIYDILNKNWFLTKTDCSGGIKCTDFYNQTGINQVQQVFNRQLQQLKGE